MLRVDSSTSPVYNIHRSVIKLLKKEIIDYPGYYAREDGNIENSKGAILSAWVDNVGYYQVVLYKNKKRCYVRVHRLIALTLIEPAIGSNQVDHINGNKLNNSIDNLTWVTNRENTRRGYASGSYLSTSKVPIKAVHKETGQIWNFDSIRSCAFGLGLNRKTITSIIKAGKANNYDFTFSVETIP